MPPGSPVNAPAEQLKSNAFADALTRYHRSRGRHVVTDCAEPVIDDLSAPDWLELLDTLRRNVLGPSDNLDLILPATKIDQARQLTKTLTRMDLMSTKAPHIRALALGLLTGDDHHVPMGTAQPYIDRYGADTVGCYMIFMGPHQHDLPFSDPQIAGAHRFLSRLWRLADSLPPHLGAPPRSPVGADLQLLRKTHQTIDQVTNTIESDFHFHVAIASIMGFVSESIHVRDRAQPQTIRFATETAASLLFPFAPHCAADAYHQLTGERVWERSWPVADPAYLRREQLQIVVQVDGKLQARFQANRDATPEQLKQLARDCAPVRERIAGRQIQREVVVPGRLVNFVTN
jgi:leucyl-tRNA synthetase